MVVILIRFSIFFLNFHVPGSSAIRVCNFFIEGGEFNPQCRYNSFLVKHAGAGGIYQLPDWIFSIYLAWPRCLGHKGAWVIHAYL